MEMEVDPQEESVGGNNTEDVVPQHAAPPSENGTAELENEIQSDAVIKEVSNVIVSEPIKEESFVSEPEVNEVTTVESNVSDEVDNIEAVVIPEVSNADVVDESLDSGLVEEVSNETPMDTVEECNIAEVTAEQEAPTEQVVEEITREACVETVAPIEEVDEDAPVIEQVVVEEMPTELPVVEETVIEDTMERVNGMPVLTKEDGSKEDTEKTNETDPASSQSEEASQTRPAEVKESAIPPHILGHAFEVDDEVRNGKVRKPRLGVKIPYRNLTSQIVSKQDIADEIMERSRLRNLTAEAPEGGDILFTKKLTKRLATKIAPTSKNDSSKSGSSSPKKSHEGDHKTTGVVAIANSPKTSVSNSTVTKKLIDTSSKITDNSDLIAILEGDDDDWDLMRPKGKQVEKRTPEWERETALKQLRELPKHRSYSKASSSSFKTSPEKLKPTQNVEPVEEIEDPLCIADDNQEPKFAMGLVTKTYTRKRKSSEDLKLLASTILQSQKKIISDKEKKPSSAPQPEKVGSHSKPKTYSHKSSSPSKHEKHSEMPNLKKESSSPVTQKHSTIPTLTPNVDNLEIVGNLQPQIIITKTVIEPKAPTVVKTPLSSPNTYISKSSRIVKKKKIWDPDEDAVPKYFKIPSLKSPTENISEKKIPTDAPTTKPAVLKPNNDKTPIIKKPSIKKIIAKKKKPKRLSEVDRLLMDEGAVNLLYAVKNTDDIPSDKKKKVKDTISLDRAQRELQNKTNEIKNDLQINSTKDSPISLRKKEAPSKITPSTKEVAAAVLQRKKSTGSSHSPPASPAFYNQHAEASRIIRRHSSSSFSSENPEGDESYSEKSSKAQRKKVRSHSSSTYIIKHQASEEVEEKTPDMKYSQFSTFTVITFKNFVQIVLSTLPSGHITLSVDALTELRAMLHLLANDDSCSVVLFSSAGTTFCDGLDYKELYCSNKIEGLNIAENYARCVRDFLISLAQFPKLLVAGVHGSAMGLGVTMLPLFDMVFASDSATFSTPYAALGCAAEGAALLTAPHSMHAALASELFFASRSLTASEALRLGLVTRTLWPDKFQAELLAVMNTVANQSPQSMQAIKMQLKDHLLSDVETLLKSESSILVQHWISKECQNNFMNYSVSK
ncbi:hypothetical protein RI129_010838 [Pyrocoelia pectoralis]|uniref:Uncharacterized protein n=1 Tax=Pyrocoelia pectoralis TaxID=417401 RepID=A0AAN7ZET1_9COLE